MPHLVAPRFRNTVWMEAVTLGVLATSALASYAIGKHTGLVHGGAFAIVTTAAGAQASAFLPRGAGQVDESSRESATLADRQAATLAAIAVGLAVLDGATLSRCTRFAHAAGAPATDTASMLAHCTLASVAPARIDIAHPMTLFAGLGALVIGASLKLEGPIMQRARAALLATLAVIVTAAIAHFGFGVGVEAVAAAALASMLASALFPAAFSRGVAHLVAATALALAAVVG